MNKTRILVIDDEPCIQSLLQDILPTCSVHVASTGREAMEQLDKESFDIIFCDLKMPDISGMDIYAQIVKNWPDVAARIVFMTGGAYTAAAQDFLLTINHPVIQKPFDINKIRHLVSTYAVCPQGATYHIASE